MSTLAVRGGRPITGTTTVPGDKSIGHRALLLAAVARGESRIAGLGPGADVASTRHCLKAYGVSFRDGEATVVVAGHGSSGWTPPPATLDCGNSGTTMRLLAGLAAHHSFSSVLDGDVSLRRRPMDRIVEPLRALGAEAEATVEGRFPPLRVAGGALVGTTIRTPVASAQVKSCILLAGLAASGTTTVIEAQLSRDHTENMLVALGAPLRREAREDGSIEISVEAFEPPGFSVEVPGDPSSAAFLLAGGVLAGAVRVEGVALNPTRTGLLIALREMGADLGVEIEGHVLGEPVGWMEARRAELRGIVLRDELVPRILDELPLLAVVATQAAGRTTVGGASELRVKESDRIAAIVDGLGRMGAEIHARPDGFVVNGPTPLRGAEVDAWGDHRIAMALAVAGLVADGETRIGGAEVAGVSWPGFPEVLERLGADVEVTDTP